MSGPVGESTLEKYAAAGRNLKRGIWAEFKAAYPNAIAFEQLLREHCRDRGESLQSKWGEPEESDITVYYRVGVKRGPK